jgi:hypothetical protein
MEIQLMKSGDFLLTTLAVLAVGIIPVDLLYTSKFVYRFKAIENDRIITSNQLATAKIVSENLNHVRNLVFRNMDFAGQKDSLPQETILFDFLTSCVNDLKLKLLSVRPSPPTVSGRVTTYGYDVQLEGDFFSFGEFCSKFENSQRVLAITSFDVSQAMRREAASGPSAPVKGAKTPDKPPAPDRHGIIISLHIDSFRVKKGF